MPPDVRRGCAPPSPCSADMGYALGSASGLLGRSPNHGRSPFTNPTNGGAQPRLTSGGIAELHLQLRRGGITEMHSSILTGYIADLQASISTRRYSRMHPSISTPPPKSKLNMLSSGQGNN